MSTTQTRQVTKAIFPVAGLGTRFLPATKANPKEMLPIVDKPLIQYAVEEAIAAGITELIFVTSSSKRAIEDHFDSNFELESNLIERGKLDLLEIVRDILPAGVSCAYIRQQSPRGLGHAVLCARQLIGDEPFAVLLADDLIDGADGGSCLQQMVAAYAMCGGSLLAVQSIARSESAKYGIIAPTPASAQQTLLSLSGIVEKPQPAAAPSTLAVVGRYILAPRIFDFLAATAVGSGGEIQLTDAIAALLQREPVHALRFTGKRYDCGSKLGYLQATLVYAMKHPEVADDFREYLQEFVACQK